MGGGQKAILLLLEAASEENVACFQTLQSVECHFLAHGGSVNYWAELDLNQRRHISNEFTVRPHARASTQEEEIPGALALVRMWGALAPVSSGSAVIS